MALDIDKFKTHLSNLQREFAFFVQFPVSNGEKISALVEATRFPTKNIPAIDAQFRGQQLKLPGNIEYPEWTCTFRVDNKLDVYNEMYKWSESVRDSETGVFGDARDYKKEVVLYQLKDSTLDLSDVLGTYILKGVFPSTLGEISLDTTSAEKQKFDVTFSLDHFTFVKGKAAGF